MEANREKLKKEGVVSLVMCFGTRRALAGGKPVWAFSGEVEVN